MRMKSSLIAPFSEAFLVPLIYMYYVLLPLQYPVPFSSLIIDNEHRFLSFLSHYW